MKKTIAFAGGGTGGHIFPIKSLIERSNPNEYKILWFGNRNSLEERIASELKEQGYDLLFLPILAGKIRRTKDFKSFFLNLIDFVKNLIGFIQSFFYLIKYNPEFIFCKGGFVAFAPSLAGKILGKKLYVHESDTIPGLVNKLIGKFADKVFLGFEEASKFFPKDKIEVVGQILSLKINNIKFPKSSPKTNLLVIGGSQGSKVLIESIYNLLKSGVLENFNIYVVGGLLNDKNIFQYFSNVNFYPFLEQKELFKLYALADISITRGSATSLAEQHYFNIKKIIVPLPYTGGNHQYYNALVYKNKYNDIVLSQQDMDFENKLKKCLEKLVSFKKELIYNSMGKTLCLSNLNH